MVSARVVDEHVVAVWHRDLGARCLRAGWSLGLTRREVQAPPVSCASSCLLARTERRAMAGWGVCICRWCRWRVASGNGERQFAVETSQREMEERLSHMKRAIEQSFASFNVVMVCGRAHSDDVRTPSRALRNGDSYPVSWRLASVADPPVTPIGGCTNKGLQPTTGGLMAGAI
jgi:hypothetical protein